MLLTSKPVKPDFDFKSHDYSPPLLSSKVARYPSPPKFDSGPSPPHSAHSSFAMGTPHRGLPPPSAMTLPDPGRGPPSMPPPLGSLPPAPAQWQGAEDGMKNWLAAKAEEERRRQEEEKTRQESLKLEQRKIEQAMLRESMSGGVPAHLVPIIFAGIGGGNLANISAEWIQQYTATVQVAHQQVQAQAQAQMSPDLRRDPRVIAQPPPAAYGGQQPPHPPHPPASVLPGQPLSGQPPPAALPSTYTGVMSPRARAAQPALAGPPTSAPRSLPQSQLPRLSTNEMNIAQPPSVPSAHQLQSQTAQQEQSSPSIYFHHWVPPSASQPEKSSSGNPPATPSGKYKASPIYQPRQRATSHASDVDYTSSPKKRKAQGQHQPAPPPTSAPQSHTSPSFSHISSSSTSTPGRVRGHARGRSDASARGPEASSAPVSRRGTVSGLAHEAIMRHSEQPEEHHRPTETKSSTEPDQGYLSHPPDSRERVQHPYASGSAGSQPETSRYSTHQHWDRGYMSSPKREVPDH